MSAQPHPTLYIQFLNRENNEKNDTSPLGKQICFTIVWGCAETLPAAISIFLSLRKVSFLHDKADREKPIGHWIIKWSDMGEVVLGEARTISSKERVIIKSKVWPDKWVGPETCCKRLNVSSKSSNFVVSMSRKSSKLRLKSPEITKASGHITFSKTERIHRKRQRWCNEGYGGRYTITYLIELHFDSPLRQFKGLVFLPIH